ncbi:MAG: metal ABC transporter permease [Anaerolineaceae bacterium]
MKISICEAIMLEWLITPLTYQFMQRALVAGILVGILCSVIGCYVILRSMAFLGDALAHAILPGIAIAYLLNGNLTLGALVAAILVALGIGQISKQGTIREDSAIGILFTAALALGVALISSIRTYAVDLSHILFGDILGIGVGDLILTATTGVIILTAVLLFYKQFLVISFDPVLAATLRWPAEWIRNALLILLALTIVVSMQTVGVGLVAAMLVTPPATAYLLTRRLPAMMALSALIGALSAILGLYISYYANIVSGPAIVLTATFFFLIAYLFSPRKGILLRRLKTG